MADAVYASIQRCGLPESTTMQRQAMRSATGAEWGTDAKGSAEGAVVVTADEKGGIG